MIIFLIISVAFLIFSTEPTTQGCRRSSKMYQSKKNSKNRFNCVLHRVLRCYITDSKVAHLFI